MHPDMSFFSCGVIVGCDQRQEWMLPFWWENYSSHNFFPVTFVDFGFSDECRAWCQEKGSLLTLSVQDTLPVSASVAKHWERAYPSQFWWDKRQFWFSKPQALVLSPYERTIWLDVDCEVLDSLSPLFDQIGTSSAIFLAKEPDEVEKKDREEKIILPGETLYNSGVIGFRKGSDRIKEWAEAAITLQNEFVGDQNLLSRLIYLKKWHVEELDPIYNWRVDRGYNQKAKIIHWVGEVNKVLLSIKAAHRPSVE
jgi:hypothetical protein